MNPLCEQHRRDLEYIRTRLDTTTATLEHIAGGLAATRTWSKLAVASGLATVGALLVKLIGG